MSEGDFYRAESVALNWVQCSERMPGEGVIVFVSGGLAQLRNGKWYSGSDNPLFAREIAWKVQKWAPINVPV